MGEAILDIYNLSKVYKGVNYETEVLKNVSFQVNQGEFLAIMGTSGSGKSTLLNILGALDEPTSGDVLLSGQSMKAMFKEPASSQYRKDYIGFIFQSFHLLKDLTVEENMAIPLLLKNEDKKEIKIKVREMIQRMGLDTLGKKRPIHLSGGQQQRVAIGRALIAQPNVILADEPTGSLDFNTSRDILDVLVQMKQEKGQSIVMVTHDPNVAIYADRILLFHDGRIVDHYICQKSEADLDVIMQKFKQISHGGNRL